MTELLCGWGSVLALVYMQCILQICWYSGRICTHCVCFHIHKSFHIHVPWHNSLFYRGCKGVIPALDSVFGISVNHIYKDRSCISLLDFTYSLTRFILQLSSLYVTAISLMHLYTILLQSLSLSVLDSWIPAIRRYDCPLWAYTNFVFQGFIFKRQFLPLSLWWQGVLSWPWMGGRA